MMTNPQIALIRDSWSRVAPSAATVGPAFYHNLFIIDPSLRPLFPADMHEQARKLMAMLSLLVGQLENSDGIVSELTGLARRHVRYGVRPEHYVSVGEALMQTLRDGLGPRWTPDLQTAWEALYQTVSAAMITLADGPGKITSNPCKPRTGRAGMLIALVLLVWSLTVWPARHYAGRYIYFFAKRT